ELDDLTLYALGLKTKDDMDAIMDAAINHTELKPDTQQWSYETICQMEFRAVLAADCYSYDENTGLYTDLRESDTGLKYLYDNAMTLHVSGIIRPSEDAVAPMLSGSIGYTSALTAYIIEQSRNSSAINAQQDQPSVDIFTGLPFRESAQNMSDAEKEQEFRTYIEVMDEKDKSDAYRAIMRIPSDQMLDASVEQIMGTMTREEMENNLTSAMTVQLGMSENDVQAYIASMSDDDITDLFRQMVVEQVRAQYAAQMETQLSGMSDAERAAALMLALETYTTEQCAAYYDEVLIFSESDYETNLSLLGCIDIDKPASVNLYASTFENKEIIEDAIAAYNAGLDELDQIRYTDYVGLMMSSVTTIINAITYVLIAFVAISLIVSSIMIGVITLISVQERTKEIGILRAIGASKRDVSGLFNAETVIIGFTSGLLGVLITDLLCIPINAILYHLTGIGGLRAFLPVSTALILIGISVILTLFAGIIPSRSAAKKDPVVALRSE
ncbi:MAG: ABC transporter permease, partial [Eubacteriales bacterium]